MSHQENVNRIKSIESTVNTQKKVSDLKPRTNRISNNQFNSMNRRLLNFNQNHFRNMPYTNQNVPRNNQRISYPMINAKSTKRNLVLTQYHKLSTMRQNRIN
jgi:hypothetical protein